MSLLSALHNRKGNILYIIESISGQISDTVGVPEPVVVIFVAIVTFSIIGVIMFFGGKFVVNIYQKYYYDELSLFVALVSIAILI